MDKEGAIFCVCEKCGEKIYTHQGCLEAPTGHFTFSVKCSECGFIFSYNYATEARRNEEKKKQLSMPLGLLGRLLNPKTMAKMQKRMMEEMDKEVDE